MTIQLQDKLFEAFKASLRGELLIPSDAGYEDARKVWNAHIDRRPALILRCTGVADVIQGVNFARDNGMLLAVRSGAHNVAGLATCDGGLLLDLSPMKGIRVDPDRRRVRAEPGVKWGEFDHETQAFGLATTGGTNTDTGIGGLTLGGGFGWLAGKYGLTVDNLTAVDIVTADGRLLKASANENEDLFWGVRGGGGNFGVVTSFEYQLHPVGPLIYGGVVFYPVERAQEVIRFYRSFVEEAPDEVTAYAVMASTPDGTRTIVLGAAYAGPVDEGAKALAPLKELGPTVLDLMAPMPYTTLQALLDDIGVPGLNNYWKSDYVRELSDQVIDLFVDNFEAVPTARSFSLIVPSNGAIARVPANATAFPHRQGYMFGVYAVWEDPVEEAPCIAWARESWQRMQPFARGVYVNELSSDEGEDRVGLAYGANYTRLARIKAKHDPANLFRHNQNIKPAGRDVP